MWPRRESEVMVPSAAKDAVSLPVGTLTVGRPNRFASAGASSIAGWPVPFTVTEPSACVVILKDAAAFAVMAFPVLRFVNVILREPVMSVVVDPSAVLRTLMNSLSTAGVTRILNPQNFAGRAKGPDSTISHLGPRPARAGGGCRTRR